MEGVQFEEDEIFRSLLTDQGWNEPKSNLFPLDDEPTLDPLIGDEPNIFEEIKQQIGVVDPSIDWMAPEAAVLGQRIQKQHLITTQKIKETSTEKEKNKPSDEEEKKDEASSDHIDNVPYIKTEEEDVQGWMDNNSNILFSEDSTGGPEKSLKRKLQTRAASKLYRQRKKAMELQLTERLQRLEDEKKALIHQNQLAEKLLRKLQEENTRLRSEKN
ncbi:hypothetical protein PROFUN_05977 [Planoprotostelium fungivorum]|uniref:BZIP domain-containing protein n=1 Tax=Planoprotostelium fungivorum TaxID=1890364 RepID=A0A2P6NPA8_9EUKA|nr:hypothetical protein PROFUN_05977 [Planoprotostelium fungivorum]